MATNPAFNDLIKELRIGTNGVFCGVAQVDANFSNMLFSVFLTEDPSNPSVDTFDLQSGVYPTMGALPSDSTVYRFTPRYAVGNQLATPAQVAIYPNPTKGEATLALTLNEGASVSVSVCDLAGKTLTQ